MLFQTRFSDTLTLVNMPPRVLLLTLYYPPDLAAGSFRAAALVEALMASSQDVEVDVVTALPTRYSSFAADAPEEELSGRLRIRRVRLPSHNSDMIRQAVSFAHFARGAVRSTRRTKYDLVVATSSRLMTAALGAWIARRSETPLYLDVRDIFADTLQEVLPNTIGLAVSGIFSALERWTVNRAAHVNLVSRGFEDYFRERYPNRSFSYFLNGIDAKFVGTAAVRETQAQSENRPLVITYAGNIGQGQGLERIIPPLAQRMRGSAVIRVIGDGGRRLDLEKAIQLSGASNVQLVPTLPRDALLQEYLAADVLFLHLNDYEAFKKVLPSKIFEYAALGKPVWAGVAGYAARFLQEEVPNAAVFPPCDVDAAMDALQRLEMCDRPREAFVAKYTRKAVMRNMAEEVLGYTRSTAA